MHKLLETIFQTKEFLNSNNQIVQVDSITSEQKCRFLQHLIEENNFKQSVEIGFAYGTSTLAITEQVVKNGGRHLVIDKFQHSAWKGNGLDLLQQAGYGNDLEFEEEFCYVVLPKLLEQQRKFDFAYIDSTKQFDWLLVDFFYLDKILETNGIIVFDDVNFTGIRKLLRYISQFPNYNVYAQFPPNRKLSRLRKLTSWLKYLPKSGRYIKENIIVTDFELQINSGCIALIKTGDDIRNWDWHVDF